MSGPGLDIYDDDCWRGFDGIMERRRDRLFAAMDRLEALSRRLSQQADDELQRRLMTEPAEERERREKRETTLAALVIRANAAEGSTDAETLWAAVDVILADG